MQLLRLGDRGRETPVIREDDGVIYRLDQLTADIDPEFSPMRASPGPGPRSRPELPVFQGRRGHTGRSAHQQTRRFAVNRSELGSHAAESGDAPALFRSSSSNTPTLSWPLNDVSDRDYQIVHSGGQWSRQVRGNLQSRRAFAGSREMQLSQIPKVDASFDEKNQTSAGRAVPDVCGWAGGPAWLPGWPYR